MNVKEVMKYVFSDGDLDVRDELHADEDMDECVEDELEAEDLKILFDEEEDDTSDEELVELNSERDDFIPHEYDSMLNNMWSEWKSRRDRGHALSGGASDVINKYIASLSQVHPFLKNYQYLIYQYFLSDHFKDKQLLILWMTVGSGKTLLSISCGIAGLNTKMFDKVVILSPKSIQDEFKKNLLLYCTLSNPPSTPADRIQSMYDMCMSKFHLIAYNSWKASKEFHRIQHLDNSLFIIDEAHLFTKAIMKVNLMHSDMQKGTLKNKGNAKRIYDTIKGLKHKKILALTGTPSSKMPFEMVPLFNLAYKVDLFTTNMQEWNDYYVDDEHAEMLHKNELIFKLNGLIAYVPRPVTETSVIASPLQIVNVEMGYDQYKQYLIDYKKELEELGHSPFMNMYGYKFGKISSYHTKTFEDCVYWNKYLTNKDHEDREAGKTHSVNSKHCPKIIRMFKDSQEIKGTCVFYFRFTGIYGIASMARLLELNGYESIGARENVFTEGKKKRYAIFSGDISNAKRNKWKDWFNDKRNCYGKYIKYLLLSPSGSVGITLKNVMYLGIGSVDFVYATVRQIMGRVNRLDSHIDLPKKDRKLVNKMYIMSKNMQYYEENKYDVKELCKRTTHGCTEIAPTIERIIFNDSIHDDEINEDFKNNVLIPASITEKVYDKFNVYKSKPPENLTSRPQVSEAMDDASFDPNANTPLDPNATTSLTDFHSDSDIDFFHPKMT